MYKNLTGEKVDKIVDKYWELNEDNIINCVIADNVKESIVSEIDGLVEELFADNKLGPSDFTNYIWGRTTNGPSIVEDFINDKRKMDIMHKI